MVPEVLKCREANAVQTLAPANSPLMQTKFSNCRKIIWSTFSMFYTDHLEMFYLSWCSVGREFSSYVGIHESIPGRNRNRTLCISHYITVQFSKAFRQDDHSIGQNMVNSIGQWGIDYWLWNLQRSLLHKKLNISYEIKRSLIIHLEHIDRSCFELMTCCTLCLTERLYFIFITFPIDR